MLCSISSDVFLLDNKKRSPIDFHPGLNVILGDNEGSNSIGKSTMLLIIDFAFGGDDYINKLKSIKDKIGGHYINFCFEFDNIKYYFTRSTEDYKIVHMCNDVYDKVRQITIEEFRNFLFVEYKINIDNLTFRGLTSKFFRIYGRSCVNENLPLKSAENEKVTDQIISLLKQYNCYSVILDLEKTVKEKKEEKTIFSKAQKYNIIDKITKTQLKQIEKELVLLENKRLELSLKSTDDLLNMDSIQADEIVELKRKLSSLKRNRGQLKSQLRMLDNNLTIKDFNLENTLNSLQRFFPNVNIKTIQETEKFHNDITNHLLELYNEEKERLTNLSTLMDNEISLLEDEINCQGIPSTISQTVFKEYSAISSTIEKLEKQKKSYYDLEKLNYDIKEMSNKLVSIQLEQLHNIENEINYEMAIINNMIFSNLVHSPIIEISKPNKYRLYTPYDTGTGIAYKGLITFDLASLNLTRLPALIHDSIIFKNIASSPLEKIFELYSKYEKQIFIAFDKIGDYSSTTQAIINNNAVLKLSTNGNQLFGRTWSELE